MVEIIPAVASNECERRVAHSLRSTRYRNEIDVALSFSLSLSLSLFFSGGFRLLLLKIAPASGCSLASAIWSACSEDAEGKTGKTRETYDLRDCWRGSALMLD